MEGWHLVGNKLISNDLINVNIEYEVFVRRLAVIIEFVDDTVEISILFDPDVLPCRLIRLAEVIEA
jgi:hypothetical protein